MKALCARPVIFAGKLKLKCFICVALGGAERIKRPVRKPITGPPVPLAARKFKG